MNTTIYSCDADKFPFDNISLANPQGLQGGAYVSKLKLLGEPITLQTPSCTTKNGIVKTDKKIYSDLVFDYDDEKTRHFFTTLEDKIKDLIFDKKDIWFHTDMDMDTIEYHWQNILRPYKSSKLLLRCNIKKPNRSKLNMNPSIQIYDEDETLLNLDSITPEKNLVGLLCLNGLKFTSQSFSLDFSLEQVMLLKKRVYNNKCLIQINNMSIDNNKSSIESIKTLKEPTIESTEKPTVESTEKPIVESTEESVIQSTEEPAIESTEEPTIESTEEHVIQSIEEPVIQSTDEPVVESIEDHIIEIKDNNNNDCDHVPSRDKEINACIAVDTDELLGENVKDQTKTLEQKSAVDILSQNQNNLAETTNALVKSDQLNEVVLSVEKESEPLKLKEPNEVYLQIYKEVRNKAIIAKRKAVEAYLEMKRIKSLYMLDEMDDSDEDNLEHQHDTLELNH